MEAFWFLLIAFARFILANKFDISDFTPQTVKIDSQTQIWILDKLLPKEELSALLEYGISDSNDVHFTHQDLQSGLRSGVTPFYTILNKTEFKDLKVFLQTQSILEELLQQQVHLEEVHTEALHSLDPKPPIKDACRDAIYNVGIFLNPHWQHNSYGQISFYAQVNNSHIDEESRLEIVHTVHPKPARMVIWPCGATYSAHPPSVNFFGNLLMLKMRFSVGNDEAEDKPSESEPAFKTSQVKFGDLKFLNEDSDREIEYKDHLKRTFYDKRGRGIYVFDDLYTLQELRKFREHLLMTSSPHGSEFDGTPLEDHDNVQWIAGFAVEEFLKTPVWRRMKELLLFVTDEDEWHPYDVALNYVRPADHTRIHPDAEKHQHEYTYLLYLSENVTRNDYGETVFFEQKFENLDGIHKFTEPGGEEYEPITSVWPKFGRVVIFRNVIEHSARPFSTSYLGCRYSFAAKVSRTKRLSLIKQLYEMTEKFQTEGTKFTRELSSGKHDNPTKSGLSLTELEEKLQVAGRKAKGFIIESSTSLKKILV